MSEKIQQGMTRVLQATLVGGVVWAGVTQSWSLLFVSVLSLFVSFLPFFLSRNFKLSLPIEFQLIITVFVYASLILGEVGDFYYRFWWWDLMLHAISGVALGFVGFLILYALYVGEHLEARAFLIALFTFCFGVALGTVWEVLEFAIDGFFGLSMQKSGLVDTMWDLIVDSVGSLLAATGGYFYIKRERKGPGMFSRLTMRFFDVNPRLKHD